MRIGSSEAINANVTMNNNSAGSAEASPKSVSEATNGIQPNIKGISQLNDYDMGNMPVSEKVVIEAIQKANKAISGGNMRFEFSIHEKTNEIVVKVFNSETDELVREIPNEKVLDMVAKMCEMAGILVDERR